MSILDIIVIAILAVFALIGFIKGFLNTVLSLFGNLASLAIAIVIVKPCARFFDSIFHLVDWLGGLIIKGIANILPDLSATTMTADEVINHLNTQQGLIGRLTALFVNKDLTYGVGASDLSATLSTNMGQFATTVFTVIIMFILIRIGILILSKIFDAITKKRALSGLDRLLGLVIGLVKGAVVLTCVLSVLYTLSPIIPQIDAWIQQSSFTNWLYGYVNQLINWVINTVDWKAFGMIK